MWVPSAVPAGWAPYHDGHWVWQAPWGWTWVDDAPWGFAPFHYGRWAYASNAWFWVPGTIGRAVYAPALVQELIEYLSPWAFESGKDITFGGRIYKSVLLQFVEKRPYVDYVTSFKMYTYTTTPVGAPDVAEAVPETPDVILQGLTADVLTQENLLVAMRMCEAFDDSAAACVIDPKSQAA